MLVAISAFILIFSLWSRGNLSGGLRCKKSSVQSCCMSQFYFIIFFAIFYFLLFLFYYVLLGYVPVIKRLYSTLTFVVFNSGCFRSRHKNGNSLLVKNHVDLCFLHPIATWIYMWFCLLDVYFMPFLLNRYYQIPKHINGHNQM